QKTAECAIRHSGCMAETTAVCRGRKAEKKFQKAIKENPHNLPVELGGTHRRLWGPHRIRDKYI
ncbi:hypothetical protein ACVZLX_004990, partial [Escherichia coli]